MENILNDGEENHQEGVKRILSATHKDHGDLHHETAKQNDTISAS